MEAKFICIDEPAFYELVNTLYKKLKKEHHTEESKWLTGEQVMNKLHITSKATLQKLRDTNAFRFTKDTPVILYDRDSVNSYIEKSAKKL